MTTFALDACCLICRSRQTLEPRWVGVGATSPGRSPRVAFWSIALCAPCRQTKMPLALHERLKRLRAPLSLCGLGLFLCWLGWGMGPAQPPPGFRWTLQAQGFYNLMAAAPYVFGLGAVIIAPVLLWRCGKVLRARAMFRKSGRELPDVLDEIYAGAAKERLASAIAEADAPSLVAARGDGDLLVVGAGPTPEATLDLSWAKVFLRQYPERRSQAADACDEKLRALPLYFVYGVGVSALLMILGGVLDSENRRGWTGLLHVPGIILLFPSAGLILIPWLEGGLNDFRKTFQKGLFGSRALRRYWGGVFLALLMVAFVVPSYRYGARKHPFLPYTDRNDMAGGWTVHLEYPRHWGRGASELILKHEPKVWINLYSDTTLTNDPQALQTAIKNFHEKFSTADALRIEPLVWSGDRGWRVDQHLPNGRMLTAYLPAPKGCFVLRLWDPESSPVHEESFRRVLASCRITRP